MGKDRHADIQSNTINAMKKKYMYLWDKRCYKNTEKK